VLLTKTYPAIEYLLIDVGSTDGALDIVKKVRQDPEKFSALIGSDDGVVEDEKYSNELIAKILSRISRESKMTQLAAEYQIPAEKYFDLAF